MALIAPPPLNAASFQLLTTFDNLLLLGTIDTFIVDGALCKELVQVEMQQQQGHDDEWFNGRKPTAPVPATNLVLATAAGNEVDMQCKEEDEEEAISSSVVKASEVAVITKKTDKKIKKTVRFSEPLIMKNSVRFADPIDDEAGVKEEEQGEQVNEEGHGVQSLKIEAPVEASFLHVNNISSSTDEVKEAAMASNDSIADVSCTGGTTDVAVIIVGDRCYYFDDDGYLHEREGRSARLASIRQRIRAFKEWIKAPKWNVKHSKMFSCGLF